MNIDSLNRIKNKLNTLIFTNLEKAILRNSNTVRFPPILIIGPARSGTTLVYQCIVKRFNLCYFTNLMSSFNYCPAIVDLVLSKIGSTGTSFGFASDYGKTKGIHSPSQGNQIWGRWFKGHGPGHPISETSVRDMVRIISSIEYNHDLPFVTKWPGFSVYIDSVANIFKDCVFVRVHREPVQTIKSVLKGRQDLRGGGQFSISRLPSSYSYFKDRDPLEQVCAYVIGVEKDIDDSIKRIGKDRFKTIDYNLLCNNPDREMDEIKSWYYKGSNIKLKDHGTIDEKFVVSNKLNFEEKERIENTYNCIKKELYAIA